MQYEDFVVRIGPHHQLGQAVYVVSSPAGQAIAPFVQPFPDERPEVVLGGLARCSKRDGGGPDRDLHAVEKDDCSLFTPKRMGEELFRSLLSGEVRSCFDKSIGAALRDQGAGLRLKLRFDLDDPVIANLARLPWELLSPPGAEALALSRRTPVVRYLEVNRPAPPRPPLRPLRILVVVADSCELDVEHERRNLEAAWQGIPQVQVLYERAHLDSVRRTLLRQHCHVLHYMGHGLFDHGTGTGALPFTGNDGSLHLVSGDLLATQVRDTSLRLVFLNACDTARARSEAGHNPYSGVATALVRKGLPAVLAMQLPISDRAAVEFSTAFYRSLAAGDPIDAATCEGRLALHRSKHATEWSTPVLFMRVDDGRLFLPHDQAGAVSGAAEPSPLQHTARPRWQRCAVIVGALGLAVTICICLLVLIGKPGSRSHDTRGPTRPGGQHVGGNPDTSREAKVPALLMDSDLQGLPVRADHTQNGVESMVTYRSTVATLELIGPSPDEPGEPFDHGAGICTVTTRHLPSSEFSSGCIPASWCCRICTDSQACGAACIRLGYACRQPPGCACNSDEVCDQATLLGLPSDPAPSRYLVPVR